MPSTPVRSVEVTGLEAMSVSTRHGPATVRQLHPNEPEHGLLVLTHGSSGDSEAPDLRVAAQVALEAGLTVALLDQPYRVAGRRIPPRGPAVDEAWIDAVSHVRSRHPDGPLVTGGRSFGARVACRGAAATRSEAVVALAFPTLPSGAPPEKTRLPELRAVPVPTVVVSGERDPFGAPAPDEVPEHVDIVVVPGDHGLRTRASLLAVRDAITVFLSRF